MKKNGRPSSFTEEMATMICARLAAGESLRGICRDAGMPDRSTVTKWVIDDVEGFSSRYERARNVGLDEMADEVIEIADEKTEKHEDGQGYAADVASRRLRFDARRWYLSKLAPRRYGERTAMEVTGEGGGPVQFSDTERAARIAAILAAAQARKDSDGSDQG